MTRQFAMLTFLFAAAAGTVWSWQVPVDEIPGPDPTRLGPVAQSADAVGRRLDDRIRRRRLFAVEVQGWIRRIDTGATLEQAADALIDYCNEHYPEYLDQVDFVEQQPTLRLKVVRNLLRHFESDLAQGFLTPAQIARMPELRRQALAARVRL